MEALQTATVLLPDENREVLQSLLLFLADISHDASEHQMTASNLAVCFAPSLFNMSGTKVVTQSPSPRRPRKNLAGVPDARELQEQKAAHECLTTMILECKKLFIVSHMYRIYIQYEIWKPLTFNKLKPFLKLCSYMKIIRLKPLKCEVIFKVVCNLMYLLKFDFINRNVLFDF